MDFNRMNQREMASALNLDQGQVSRYLNGKMSPSLERAKLIADYLECSLDELYRLINNKLTKEQILEFSIKQKERDK